MNISEAKSIRIVDYLRQLGYKPQFEKYGQYWYLSPFRRENTPSFKVNDRQNIWYDFGLATGGDLVELGKYLYQTDNVSEVLSLIGQLSRSLAVSRVCIASSNAPAAESLMRNIAVVSLQHGALISYLRSRQIDTDIGRTFCREIHYDLRKRHYYGIGFANMSGGYEIRNPYYKGCIARKDITVVKHQQEQMQSHICVFEGFMDFLSYLTLKRREDKAICITSPADYLVMNSVSNLKKTLIHLSNYRYIHCYLDNDLAGQKTVETITGLYEERVSDESSRYSEYKDLNDYIRRKRL